MKKYQDWEHVRQGFADVLDLIIPYMPKDRQKVAIVTIEAYHSFADKKVVQYGGKSVNREYKMKRSKNGGV